MSFETSTILFLLATGYDYIHSKKYILDFPLEWRNTIIRNKYDFLTLLAIYVLYLCNRDASVSLGALISNICNMMAFHFPLWVHTDAEWDFGGFPYWLLAIKPALTLRSSDPAFVKLVCVPTLFVDN